MSNLETRQRGDWAARLYEKALSLPLSRVEKKGGRSGEDIGARKVPFYIPFIAGAIAVLGHAPFFIKPLFFLGVAILFVLADQQRARHSATSLKGGFRLGYWFGLGYFIASLYWIASAFLTRGGFYVFLAPLGVVALPLGLALFWAGALQVYVRFVKGGLWTRVVAFTFILFAAEWLRGHILSGFPWNLPGYIWPAGGAVSQSASLFGIYGLSLVTLFIAASLGAAFTIERRYIQPLIASGLMVIGLTVFGGLRLRSAPVGEVEGEIEGPRFRLVQVQMDQLTKFEQDNYSAIIDRYLSLTTAAPKQGEPVPTHIVWPEGAIPGFSLEDEAFTGALAGALAPEQTLLMGATRRVYAQDWLYYNSLVGLTARGAQGLELTSIYDKSKLVPFGEYFPGGRLVEALKIPALSAAVSSFNRGTKTSAALYGLPPASPQICYEAIFSGFTPYQKDRPEPQWILNISNDSWFGRSTGPWQHFNQTQYRAIEEGLPIIRVASSGITSRIDPYGRRLDFLSPYEDGFIDGALPQKVKTPVFRQIRKKFLKFL